MVSQVGSITSATNNNSLAPLNPMDAISGNNTNVNSVFNYGNPLTSGTTYDNDMFMPAYLKTPAITAQGQQVQAQNPQMGQQAIAQNQAAPQQTAQPQYDMTQQQAMQPQYNIENPQQQTAQTQNLQNPQFTGQSDLNGCLTDQDDNVAYTPSGNAYQKASLGKKSGAILGFLAPIANTLIRGSKDYKQLLKTCPLLAIAGFGIGYLVDSCTESNRAKAADEAAKQPQVAPAQYQQPMSAVA